MLYCGKDIHSTLYREGIGFFRNVIERIKSGWARQFKRDEDYFNSIPLDILRFIAKTMPKQRENGVVTNLNGCYLIVVQILQKATSSSIKHFIE